MILVGGGRRSGPGEEKGTDVKSAGSGELREFGTFENIWAVTDQLRRISETYNIATKIWGVTSSSLLHWTRSALAYVVDTQSGSSFVSHPPSLGVLAPEAGRAVGPARWA